MTDTTNKPLGATAAPIRSICKNLGDCSYCGTLPRGSDYGGNALIAAVVNLMDPEHSIFSQLLSFLHCSCVVQNKWFLLAVRGGSKEWREKMILTEVDAKPLQSSATSGKSAASARRRTLVADVAELWERLVRKVCWVQKLSKAA